jgi:hypothetical protein
MITFTRAATLFLIVTVYVALLLLCRHPDDFPMPAGLPYLPLLFGPPVFAAFGSSGLVLLLVSTFMFFSFSVFALFASRRRIPFAVGAAIVWFASSFFMYALHI